MSNLYPLTCGCLFLFCHVVFFWAIGLPGGLIGVYYPFSCFSYCITSILVLALLLVSNN